MEVQDLESRLGKFQAAYTSKMGKIMVNAILALFWLFLGLILFNLFWDFYKERGTAIMAGLIFLVTGAAYVIIPYRQRAGRKAHLYEEGIWISIRGKAQSWRYDEIDGVRIISGKNKQAAEGLSEGISEAIPLGGFVGGFVKGAIGEAIKASVPIDQLVGEDINSYQFLIGERQVFEIGPEYKRWKELGAAIFTAVTNKLALRQIDRIRQGGPVVFEKLTAIDSGTTRLTLTQEGIQEQEKEPILWTDVVRVWEGWTPGFATVRPSDRRKEISFGLDATLNAYVTLETIKAMVEDAKADKV